MDDKIINYSEDRFNEIKNEVYKMLKKIFGDKKVKQFPFIPISGFKGDNLIKRSDKMLSWYKGWNITIKKQEISGFTLSDALDFAIKPPKRANNKPLRMPVSGIYKISGIGDVIAGRIEQGILKKGVNVRFYPSNCGGKVQSIEMHKKPVEIGKSGDNVGINIRGLKDIKPKEGDIMFIENDNLDTNPPKPVTTFTTMIYVQDHPGQLKVGFTPVIHIRTAKTPAKMIAIKWKRNIQKTGKDKIESPTYIEKGDEAEVIFQPLKPFVCEPFTICKPLGRLAAMDQNNLVLLGKVIDVSYDKPQKNDDSASGRARKKNKSK